MKNIGINNCKQQEESFKETNARENLYYEEFQGCKKSWMWGTVFGVLAGILCGLLFSGFKFNDIFFGMSALMSVSCVWAFSTIFGLKNTEDFGLSCIPIGIFSVASAVLGFFVGTYILAWVALLLLGIAVGAWLIGFSVFALLFPLETVYYWIRYSIEKRQIKKSLNSRDLATA